MLDPKLNKYIFKKQKLDFNSGDSSTSGTIQSITDVSNHSVSSGFVCVSCKLGHSTDTFENQCLRVMIVMTGIVFVA